MILLRYIKQEAIKFFHQLSFFFHFLNSQTIIHFFCLNYSSLSHQPNRTQKTNNQLNKNHFHFFSLNLLGKQTESKDQELRSNYLEDHFYSSWPQEVGLVDICIARSRHRLLFNIEILHKIWGNIMEIHFERRGEKKKKRFSVLVCSQRKEIKCKQMKWMKDSVNSGFI